MSNGKAENSASAGTFIGPKPTSVRFHDSSAHGQAHPHTIRFGRDEWLKQPLPNLIWKAGTGISNADLHHPALDKAGNNRKLTHWLVLHGLDGVPK
jgi:hypothetical protein